MDRVDGNLNLSRAIGDHIYKVNEELPSTEQMVINLPEIHTETIDKDTVGHGRTTSFSKTKNRRKEACFLSDRMYG